MDKVRPDGTEDQSVTSPSGEYLGINVHGRHSKCIRKYTQRYDPVFGASRGWNHEVVASIVYMTQYGDLNRDVDTDDKLSLMAE